MNIKDVTVVKTPYLSPRFRTYEDAIKFSQTRDTSLCIPAFVTDNCGKVSINPDYQSAPYEESIIQCPNLLSAIVKK